MLKTEVYIEEPNLAFKNFKKSKPQIETRIGKISIKQELLCSTKRRMRTFQIHSEIISYFFNQ